MHSCSLSNDASNALDGWVAIVLKHFVQIESQLPSKLCRCRKGGILVCAMKKPRERWIFERTRQLRRTHENEQVRTCKTPALTARGSSAIATAQTKHPFCIDEHTILHNRHEPNPEQFGKLGRRLKAWVGLSSHKSPVGLCGAKISQRRVLIQ